MYIPEEYKSEDRAEAISFIRQFSFGTLVTAVAQVPVATHIPFLVRPEGKELYLIGHMAANNEQHQLLEKGNVLVIFQEPNAYISPKNYQSRQNVPTWNYMAVHIYGKVTPISGQENIKTLLEKTMETYEPGYMPQWHELDDDYKYDLMKGVAGFEIKVTDLQFVKKLSQDKSNQERKNIIQSLSSHSHSCEAAIAEWMKKDLEKK